MYKYNLKIDRNEFFDKLTMKLIHEPTSRIIGKKVVNKGWMFYLGQPVKSDN